VGNCPYGYRLRADGKTLEPNPSEQEIKETIQKLRQGGRTLRQIAADLNKKKLSARSGSPWLHCYVARILKAA